MTLHCPVLHTLSRFPCNSPCDLRTNSNQILELSSHEDCSVDSTLWVCVHVRVCVFARKIT